MKLFPSLRRKPDLPIEAKKSRGYSLHFDQWQEPSWTKREYTAFCREAYKMNVVAYSAINRIANAVASMEWEVWQGGQQLTASPVLDLLARPNPLQSGPDWWRSRIGYLLLSGNTYDERVVDSTASRIIELWPLRPDRVSIIKSPTGLPGGFIYAVSADRKVKYSADPTTGDSDILHTRLFNPLDDWYGMSPIESGAFAVDQHNESMKWIQALLQNSARPSGALVVDSETALSDDEYARMKTEIEQQYSGASNAGRPLLLEGGLDWKQMGLSPMDMEILRVKDSSARDISLAFGVPPLLLNIPGDNTYANYREARLGFYEDTILPFVGYMLAEMNQWLQPFFPGVEIRPNRDKIEAIADKRMKLWDMADNSDDLTLNESRALKGYDPLPEPLGSTLMSEVRAAAKPQPPEADPAVAETMKELAYGRTR